MKKRYLIMLIIAILLVITLGAGFAYVYFFTDTFKSNKQLFFKYISQNKEIAEIFHDNDIKAYCDKQKNTPFTSQGSIKTNVTFPDSSEAQMANALQNCNITFIGNSDNSKKYSHHTIKANYSDTESMQFELYKNGDIFATKISDVLFKYVGIENNNLKEFAKKIQLPENITSSIPDKLDLTKLEKTSNIFSDEEKSSLENKYLKIITDNISDDMFSRESTSDDIIYILTINEEQLKNIYIKILESLKEDDTIIGKFKEILINEYNFTEENVQTYVTQYKETIENLMNSINSNPDSDILAKAMQAKASNEKAQIRERIMLVYLSVSAEANGGTIEKNKLQAELENEFGPERVTDLADDLSTVKIDGIEYSFTRSSTNSQETENVTNSEDENSTTENNTASSNNIVVKVHSNKDEISKTEIILDGNNSFIISKSDEGIKLEVLQDNLSIYSAYAQKLKSPNETRFEFSFSEKDSEIFNLTTSFSGLDTNSINESSELTFDIDLGNSMITDAKTKFVSIYKNTKTFGEIQKIDVANSDILLINTAPSKEHIEQLYEKIQANFTQVNSAKLLALGLTEEQNPFMYYIPSIVPVSATYIMQNPDKSPYFAVPAILGGVSISMLSADNNILARAESSRMNLDISNVKEEILLTVNGAISEYYEKKYSNKSEKVETLEKEVDKVLKKFSPSGANIEYSYKNKKITIKLKDDPSKQITGVVSEEGRISWSDTIN